MNEFVDEFIGIVNQETEDEVLWQFFLHKVYDKSYQEFIDECKVAKKPEKPVDFETAARDSINILDGFVPE
ncbi:hypothetical protein [Bacillus infantis]|uniref:hypothetical protein n=1 Tax=Bacillus infantis TaxID=324767 RepID=UPI003CEC78D8